MLAQLDVDVAALGNLDRVFQGLGQIAEQLGHFLRAFQVLLVAVVLRPTRVIEGAALTDAHARLMGLEIFLLDEAHIVGRHQRCSNLVRQGDGSVQVLFVIGAVGALDFHVEPIGKHRHPLTQQRFGILRVTPQQCHTDIALLGRGQGNKPFAGRRDPFLVDDHLAIALAFDEAAGNQLGQVAVTLGIHRQQADPAQRRLGVAIGQPQVGTANRLDPGAHGGFVELDQRTHVVLVGHGHRRHVHPGQGLDQRLDPHQAIDQRIFGMQAKMNERSRHGDPISAKNNKARIVPGLGENISQLG
ncbi:hypothetical protein D3C76_482050 [compost metagenome]